MGTPSAPRETRRITVEVSARLYAAIVAAKVFSGRSISNLTCEGLELVSARYRNRRREGRAARETPVVINTSGDPS